jgi:hypothetical protein
MQEVSRSLVMCISRYCSLQDDNLETKPKGVPAQRIFVLAFSFFNMSRIRFKRKLGRKAFISDIIVDIWAIIIFVVVIIIFYLIFKASATAREQTLRDKQDIVYGNYLAQVYMRTPLSIGSQKLTMGELIAIYDYNQSLEKIRSKSFAESAESLLTSNPMRKAIVDFTDDFVGKNFDSKRCYLFAIHSKNFDYVLPGMNCVSAMGAGFAAGGWATLNEQLKYVPNATYVTYLATVDPRGDPIMIYSIYDFERTVALYVPK